MHGVAIERPKHETPGDVNSTEAALHDSNTRSTVRDSTDETVVEVPERRGVSNTQVALEKPDGPDMEWTTKDEDIAFAKAMLRAQGYGHRLERPSDLREGVVSRAKLNACSTRTFTCVLPSGASRIGN